MKMLTQTINRFTGLIIVSIIFILMLHIKLCFALPSIRLISVKFIRTSSVESIKLLLKGKPDYLTFNLQNPDRFVVDIKKCYFPKIYYSIKPDSKYFKAIRAAQFRHDRVRLVLDRKIIAHISIRKKERSHYTELDLSIQLPELARTESNPVARTKKDVSPHTSGNSNPSDTDIDTLFSAPEEASASNAMIPDIIPDETKMNAQPDVTGDVSKLSVNGNLKNKTAYRLDTPHHLSMAKNTLSLKASGDLSDRLSYVIGSRFSYDAVFDLTDEYNNNVEKDQRLEAYLRDAFLDLGFGNLDLRLGNQQIVWGQAVGLFVADIVNPKDFKDYILPDLDQIRIPVPAANMEYYNKNLYVQMIFIPFPKFNEFGKQGSEFDFSKSLYNKSADIVLKNPSDPSNSLDNSEIGFRISNLNNGWDYSLFYFYDYYNFPVNYRRISINPPGSPHPFTIRYLPEYKRMNRIGSTFSKEVMDAVFKGEFLYNHTMFFQSSDIADLDGIEKSDSFDWLLGVDYTFFKSLETNFQLLQTIILDYKKAMIQKQYTTAFSIWMRTGFYSNMIQPELFFVSSLNQKDYMFRPKITYNYNDKLKFIFGTDIFYGKSDGDFGLFDNNDRIFEEVIYLF